MTSPNDPTQGKGSHRSRRLATVLVALPFALAGLVLPTLPASATPGDPPSIYIQPERAPSGMYLSVTSDLANYLATEQVDLVIGTCWTDTMSCTTGSYATRAADGWDLQSYGYIYSGITGGTATILNLSSIAANPSTGPLDIVVWYEIADGSGVWSATSNRISTLVYEQADGSTGGIDTVASPLNTANAVTFTGSGAPAYGTVKVEVVGSSMPNPVLCSNAAVDAGGDWSCGPFAVSRIGYGNQNYSVTVTESDRGGTGEPGYSSNVFDITGTLSAPYLSAIITDSFGQGTLQFTGSVNNWPTTRVTATEWIDVETSTTGTATTCNDSSITVECTVTMNPASDNVFELDPYQLIDGTSTAAIATTNPSYFFWMPHTPTLAAAGGFEWAAAGGTGETGSELRVYDAGDDSLFCSIIVDGADDLDADAGEWSCAASGLAAPFPTEFYAYAVAPDGWETTVHPIGSTGDQYREGRSDVTANVPLTPAVWALEAPQITVYPVAPDAPDTVEFGGLSHPDVVVRVYRDGADSPTSPANPLCEVTADASGFWQGCTALAADIGYGEGIPVTAVAYLASDTTFANPSPEAVPVDVSVAGSVDDPVIPVDVVVTGGEAEITFQGTSEFWPVEVQTYLVDSSADPYTLGALSASNSCAGDADNQTTCTISGAGLWAVTAYQAIDTHVKPVANRSAYYIWVPDAPVIDGAEGGALQATVYGTGEVGARVTVYERTVDPENALCTADVIGGSWSCTATGLARGAGPFIATQASTALWLLDTVVLPLPGNPAPDSSTASGATSEASSTVPASPPIFISDVFTVETAFPDGPQLQQAGYTVDGHAPAGNHVVVSVDGDPVCESAPSTLVEGYWLWSCTIAPGALSLGDQTLVYRAYSESDIASGAAITDDIRIVQPADASLEVALGRGAFTATGEGPGDETSVVDVFAVAGANLNLATSCAATGGSPASCAVTGAGNWAARAHEVVGVDGGEWSLPEAEWTTIVVHVPAAPTVGVDGGVETVLIGGNAEPGALVLVADESGSTVCSTTAGSTGAWDCGALAETAGEHEYLARQTGASFSLSAAQALFPAAEVATRAGTSAETASGVVTVTAPKLPETGLDPFDWSFQLIGDGELHPGDRVRIVGQGVPADSLISAELHSDPVLLGETTAGKDGRFDFAVTIPEVVEPGAHEIYVFVTAPGYPSPVSLSQPAAISTLPEPPADVEEATPAPASPTAPALGAPESVLPNMLTSNVPTLATVLANPLSIALAGALAIGFLFLVAIPSELLTSTLGANTSRLGGFVSRSSRRFEEWIDGVPGGKIIAAVVMTVLVSVIFGFSDPGFDWNPESFRLVLALAIAYFVLYYVLSFVVGKITESVWKVPSTIEVQPTILLLAVFGVLVSRLIGFAPGILVGVVIGLALLKDNRRAELGSTLMLFGGVLVLGLGSWLGYSALTANGAPADFGTALAADTLAALTVEGLTGLLVAALPLTFLEGRTLWDASKPLWAGSFLLAAIAFALIVLPTSMMETELSHVGFWYLILLAYAVIVFGIWGWFVWRTSKEKAGADTETDPRAEPSRRM